MNYNQRSLGIGGGALLTGAALFLLAMGPLDPPDGPVTETGPSLSELDSKLDQILAGQGGMSATDGPWEVFRAPATGPFVDSNMGSLVAQGDVYVHSITHFRCAVFAFDGEGSMDGNTLQANNDNWIARSVHVWTTTGDPGRGQYNAITVPVEQVVHDGLYMAWDTPSSGGFVYVLYKPLP